MLKPATNPSALRNGRPAEETHLHAFWNFLLRNRLLAFGVPALLVAATAAFLWFVAPVYDAVAWIRIDEQRSNLPVLDALKDLSSGSQIATEVQVLRRRPLAAAVVDSLDLQLSVAAPRGVLRSELFDDIETSRNAPEAEYRFRRGADGRFTVTRDDADTPLGTYAIGEVVRLDGVVLRLAPGAAAHEEIRVVVQTFRAALKAFREALAVGRPDREADLVTVAYQGTDPELVRDVPNAMATFFIRQRRAVKRTDALGTIAFIEEQIDTLSGQLRAAEEELRRYRSQNNIVSFEFEAEAQMQRLADMQAERDLLDARRGALASLLAEVDSAFAAGDTLGQSPYRRLIAFPSLLSNFAVSELFRSMNEVENERAELLNRRTPEDPEVQVLTGRIHDLERQLRSIAVTYLEGLANNVRSLNTNLARFEDELSLIPSREIDYLRRKREAEVLQEIYTMLQTRLQEAQIAASVDDSSVRVVEPAVLPLEPIKPRKMLSLGLAVVLGLVLGLGAAFARENMDTTVHTREDLQALLEEIPVLGSIPRIREAVGNGGARRGVSAGSGAAGLGPRLVAGRDPRNPVSEAYRSLRTNITFSRIERAPRTMVLTSPTPGDGKSTSASNLAITLAQQSVQCLLVDADMRRGFLNDIFGVAREPGLSNVLLGRTSVEDAIQRIELGESGALDFLPTGTLPPNPAELLGSRQMQELLATLAERYEAVILDAPPLTLVTDAAVLGTYADGVVVVARAGVTDRGAIRYALDQLTAVRAPVLGAVLNDVDQRKERYYGSYSAGSHAEYYGGKG
ncbi:MAG TPA: polysaccharide biosynthesis tyrosine autokinase [Longimicrobiales bacterium]